MFELVFEDLPGRYNSTRTSHIRYYTMPADDYWTHLAIVLGPKWNRQDNRQIRIQYVRLSDAINPEHKLVDEWETTFYVESHPPDKAEEVFEQLCANVPAAYAMRLLF